MRRSPIKNNRRKRNPQRRVLIQDSYFSNRALLKQYAASNQFNPYTGAGFFLTNITAGITQGITDSQRIGDRLILQNVEILLGCRNSTGAGSNIFTTWRVIVFQFLGDNSATAPTPANMLLASSANDGTTYGSMSMYNIDYIRQYQVLYDSGCFQTYGSVTLAATGSAGGKGLATCHHVLQVPLTNCDKLIKFYAAGASGPNHLYLCVLTDRASVAVNPVLDYVYAVRFTNP